MSEKVPQCPTCGQDMAKDVYVYDPKQGRPPETWRCPKHGYKGNREPQWMK